MAEAVNRRAQEALSEEELEALIGAIDTTSPTGKRNAALVILLADTGLRIGEALALETRDLVRQAGQITNVRARKCKGNKPATPGLTNRAAVAVARWLEAREALGIGPGALFCTISRGKRARGTATAEGFVEGTVVVELQPGKALSTQYCGQLLGRLAERAGIGRRVTPHTLRHTFATHLLQHTGNLEVTKRACRHSKISTTSEVYAHVEDAEVTRAVRAMRDKAPASEASDQARAVAQELLAGLPAEVRKALGALVTEEK